MNTTVESNTQTLLELGMSHAHKESQVWLSEITFWELELRFFQKLLAAHVNVSLDDEQERQFRYFQQQLDHYKHELMGQFKQKVTAHEKYLAELLQEIGAHNVHDYRKVHGELYSHIHAFEVEFQFFKRKLYDTMEKIIEQKASNEI